jgi:hypothetical protein
MSFLSNFYNNITNATQNATKNSFANWIKSADTKGMYSNLTGRYQDIADEGILSPADMAEIMDRYHKTVGRRTSEQRARVSVGVNNRLGSRSGASQKAIYNMVDVPAMFAENEFASNLWQTNLQSRTQGLSGLGSLFSTMFGGQMGLEQQRLANEATVKAAEESNKFLGIF